MFFYKPDVEYLNSGKTLPQMSIQIPDKKEAVKNCSNMENAVSALEQKETMSKIHPQYFLSFSLYIYTYMSLSSGRWTDLLLRRRYFLGAGAWLAGPDVLRQADPQGLPQHQPVRSSLWTTPSAGIIRDYWTCPRGFFPQRIFLRINAVTFIPLKSPCKSFFCPWGI